MLDTGSLLACLDAEITETSNFIDLLEKEAETLINSESLSDIPALAAAKEASAHKLTALATERQQLLQLPEGANSHEHMSDIAASDDDLWQAWYTVLDLAEQARSLNLRNGALIEVHLRHTRQSLEALRNATGIGDVYTADGKQHTISRATTIGQV